MCRDATRRLILMLAVRECRRRTWSLTKRMAIVRSRATTPSINTTTSTWNTNETENNNNNHRKKQNSTKSTLDACDCVVLMASFVYCVSMRRHSVLFRRTMHTSVCCGTERFKFDEMNPVSAHHRRLAHATHNSMEWNESESVLHAFYFIDSGWEVSTV